MARYTRTPVSTLQGINNELAKVELAMKATLDREGSGTNFMDANLDMNSQRILNLPAPVSKQEALRLGDIASDNTGASLDYVRLNYTTRNQWLRSLGLSGTYGFFEDGFTYVSEGDVGIDTSGNLWTTTESLPYEVEAGTEPSDPSFYQYSLDNQYSRSFNSVQDVKDGVNKDGSSVDMGLLLGAKIERLGYYEASDGGSNWGIVKSGTHTEDGGKISTISGDLYVEWNVNLSSLNPLKYGAKGDLYLSDGSVNPTPTDDTAALQAAFDTGARIKMTKRGYLATVLTIPGNIVKMNGAEIQQASSYTGDFITVTEDNARISDGWITRDPEIESTNDGLLVWADNCRLSNIRTKGFFYATDVEADNCIIDNHYSEDARYAGMRLYATGNYNRFTVRNYIAKDYAVKGFVCNGQGSIDTVTIRNMDSDVSGITSPVDAMNGILFDTDLDPSVFNIKNVYIYNCNIKTAGSGNKFINVENLLVKDTVLQTENTYESNFGLLSESQNTRLVNVELDSRVQIGNDLIECDIKFKDTPTGYAHFLRITGTGDKTTINRMDYSETDGVTSSVIRLNRVTSKAEYMKIGDVVGDGTSDFIGTFTAPTNDSSWLELTGSLENLGNFGTDSVKAVAFRRDLLGRKAYGPSSAPPTSGTYAVGDTQAASSITSAGAIGWVCEVAGSPGTWLKYGSTSAL